MNSNRTVVKSYAQLPVQFNASESHKIFVVKNLGVLKTKNLAPHDYHGKDERIWNLNLPINEQKEGWEIDVFASNFKKDVRGNSTIRAGNKTLTFEKIVKSQKKNNTMKAGLKKNKTKSIDDVNEGGAIFKFEDLSTGIKQRFVFNLRAYNGTDNDSLF